MQLCREIRKRSSTPIIMVTAMGDEQHLLEGFESGADNYVSKPISYRELAMRMRSVAQRHAGGSAANVVETSSTASWADLSVDVSTCEVLKAGGPVQMTRFEARVLYFLVANAGHVIPTSRLIEWVWNYEGGDSFSLKTHLSHIRQKLGSTSGVDVQITAIPHVGYKLHA